jgi:hypothetical protein
MAQQLMPTASGAFLRTNKGLSPLAYVLIPGWRAQAQQRQLEEILDADEPQDCGAIDCALGMNISDD